jgi:hypothetical protein
MNYHDPSITLLIIKIIYFLFVTYLTGWAIYPLPIFRQSHIASWVFCQSLGAGFLLLISFNMVSFDIPAKWLIIVPPLLILTRVIINKIYKKKSLTYLKNTDSFSCSFFIYVLGSIGIIIIYLMPFILNVTSGLYAYGGGDHSSYFRVSDLVVDKSLKDLIQSWGLEWPPSVGYALMHAVPTMFPPAENWSINSFLFYIKYARQSMTFANQTIGVPFIALGFNNAEESYTAGVTVYLLLLCWSAAIFTAVIMKNLNRIWTISLVAFAVALASPAMSLVLKQTIPAAYAWGSMLIFLSVLIQRKNEKSKKLGTPILFGISLASTYLMYLPAIFVSGPLWAYQFLKGMKQAWKERIRWLLIVLIVFIVSTNWEMDRPIRLFLSNALGAILDYNLKLSYLPVTLLGVADFESILQNAIYYPLCLFAAVVVLIGLYYYVKYLKKEVLVTLVFTLPILILIAYYWYKGGQYHVIRMIEFLSIVFVAMSMMGYCYALGLASRIHKIVIVALISLFAVNAILIKIYINKSIISPIPNARAGMITADDMKLAKDFQDELSHMKEEPVIYWMGRGSVPFANHEIMFRKLKYVEAFEYDYTYVKMDILDPEFINNAVLVYPKEQIADILQVDSALFTNEKIQLENKSIQIVGKGSGAVILGTGLTDCYIEKGKPVRYLRSLEGALVVWSDKQNVVQVEMEAAGLESGIYLTLRRPEIENNIFANDISILRNNTESQNEYFLRISKLLDKNYNAASDLLRFVRADIPEYETTTKFNELLLKSVLFKQFIIYNIEERSKLTRHLENNYNLHQLTYQLAARTDIIPTIIKFNLYLHPGANIIRFIARDGLGRRAGKVPLADLSYNPDINIPDIILSKIYISPVSERLKQL